MRQLNDEQLVAVSFLPYTHEEISLLRLLEKAAQVLEKALTEHELKEFITLIENGWCNALSNITYENLEPRTHDEMTERIDDYHIALNRVLERMYGI